MIKTNSDPFLFKSSATDSTGILFLTKKQQDELTLFPLELDLENTTTGRNGADIMVCDIRGKSLQPEQIYLTVSASCGHVAGVSQLCFPSPNVAIFLLHQSSCLNESSVHVQNLWIVSRVLQTDVTPACVTHSPPCLEITFHWKQMSRSLGQYRR